MGSQAQTAARLLASKGELVSIQFPNTLPTDPITGATVLATAPTVIQANGYPSQYMQKDIDGSNILAGDVRLILELIAQRPQVGCFATVDAKTYRVMDVKPIRLAGADVVYICQLRAN